MIKFLQQIRPRELPLAFWAIGYLEFLWQTTGPMPLPLGLFSWCVFFPLFSAVLVVQATPLWKELKSLAEEAVKSPAYFLLAGFFVLSFMFAIFSASRPPHLPQEYDAIHYQMGVPRQLLARHSLQWIGWSVADLWPMAMQWGFAPYSLAFPTVNKFPQLLLAGGVAGCLVRAARQLYPNARNRLPLLFPLFAFFSAHGVVTQLGTGMMDLPALYFLLLALCSLLDARWSSAALALAVYTATKSFHLFQIIPVLLGGTAWLWFGRSKIPPKPVFLKLVPLFALFSLLLLVRPALVSLQVAGTPLFPFGSCLMKKGEFCEPEKRPTLDRSASALLATRYVYGLGRGPSAFAQHLWRVAIPTKGVNNEYDYPLGLPWLFLVVLLAFTVARGGFTAPLIQLTLLFWLLWWFNSHQSRWLYPVLAFGFLATIPQQLRVKKSLPMLLLASAILSLISQARALRPTFALSASEIQAQESAKVRWHDDETLDSVELLYVNFPAPNHTQGDPLWILR